MTREEEIRQEALSAEKENFPRCAGDKENSFHGVNSAYGLGFVDGALWADANPKSTWISVEDKLPCDDKNLIHFEFTNSVLVYDENFSFLIAWMKKNSDNTWIWHTKNKDFDLHLNIIHWMPLPKLPK